MSFEIGLIPLRELSVRITKGTTPSKGKGFVLWGVNYIKSESITFDGRIDTSKFAFIDESTHSALERSQLRAGNVLFSMAGVYLGKTAVVQQEHLPANTNQAVGIISLDRSKADSYFIHYALQSPLCRSWVVRSAAQSAQPNFNLKEIGDLLIPNFSLSEQKKISGILRAFDDKIDLNRRINQTLEAMAQAIFKSWFVDFDPVRAKIAALEEGEDPLRAAMCAISGKTDAELEGMSGEDYEQLAATAVLFPDAMEDSELGEIPRGWGVKTVSDIARFAVGRVSMSEITVKNYISTENMLENRGGIKNAASLPSAATASSFKERQVLISNIRPYFKKIWLACFDGGRSNDVLAFEAIDNNCAEFLYNLLYQDEFFDFMMRTSKGAKMPRGDKEAIMNWKFVCAGDELVGRYSEKVRGFYLYAESLNAQAQELSELRDVLLPELLSGAVSAVDLVV